MFRLESWPNHRPPAKREIVSGSFARVGWGAEVEAGEEKGCGMPFQYRPMTLFPSLFGAHSDTGQGLLGFHPLSALDGRKMLR